MTNDFAGKAKHPWMNTFRNDTCPNLSVNTGTTFISFTVYRGKIRAVVLCSFSSFIYFLNNSGAFRPRKQCIDSFFFSAFFHFYSGWFDNETLSLLDESLRIFIVLFSVRKRANVFSLVRWKLDFINAVIIAVSIQKFHSDVGFK